MKIEEQVIRIVAEQMNVSRKVVTKETHFVEDLNIDSLDMIELVMEFEDKFEINIADEDAEKLLTVGSVVDYVLTHTTEV